MRDRFGLWMVMMLVVCFKTRVLQASDKDTGVVLWMKFGDLVFM